MVTKGLGCDVNIENRKNISRDSLTYSKSSTVVIAFCGPHTSEPSTRTYCVRLNPPEERWILVQGDIYFVNFDFLLHPCRISSNMLAFLILALWQIYALVLELVPWALRFSGNTRIHRRGLRRKQLPSVTEVSGPTAPVCQTCSARA